MKPIESCGVSWSTDRSVDLIDGSSLYLECLNSELIVNRSFGAAHGEWLTMLHQADQRIYEGVMIDMASHGWIGLLVDSPATLFVIEVADTQRIASCLPLQREHTGDRAFRTLDFYSVGRFVVAETEMAVIVLDEAGLFRYAIPHFWPQTRVQRASESRLLLHSERGTVEFDIEAGPELFRS